MNPKAKARFLLLVKIEAMGMDESIAFEGRYVLFLFLFLCIPFFHHDGTLSSIKKKS